jgi:hypothetical protein
MTTATAAPTWAQSIVEPLRSLMLTLHAAQHSPEAQARVRERQEAYERELHRELSGLTGKEQRASLDRVSDHDSDCATGSWHGVFFACDHDGVVEDSVALDDVADFVSYHGLPATHARARGLFDCGNCDGGDDAVEKALDGWEQEDPRIGRYGSVAEWEADR